MVTGAFSSPIAISGKASGCISSLVGTESAQASTVRGDNEETPNTAVASATTDVVRQNSRRGVCKGGSLGWEGGLKPHRPAGQPKCGKAGATSQTRRGAPISLVAAPHPASRRTRVVV